jgi:ectoine hydroxylase-related dioxygenase (phytanoyl-CoA dioxygenase family)
MTKGSCLLYTGKVYHGGGANLSDGIRVGLNVTYNVGWLRQEENQYLSVPREIAETLDDDLLRLMGYRIGAYAMGYIDDVRDPFKPSAATRSPPPKDSPAPDQARSAAVKATENRSHQTTTVSNSLMSTSAGIS